MKGSARTSVRFVLDVYIYAGAGRSDERGGYKQGWLFGEIGHSQADSGGNAPHR